VSRTSLLQHGLANIGRGPLNDVVHQIWKLWALYFQTKIFLKIAFWKPNCWPLDLLMQPIRTIWTILVGDHPGIIPVELGQIPIPGLNNFGRETPMDHSCEVCLKSIKWFQKRSRLKKLLTHGRTDDRRRTMGHHKMLKVS